MPASVTGCIGPTAPTVDDLRQVKTGLRRAAYLPESSPKRAAAIAAEKAAFVAAEHLGMAPTEPEAEL